MKKTQIIGDVHLDDRYIGYLDFQVQTIKKLIAPKVRSKIEQRRTSQREKKRIIKCVLFLLVDILFLKGIYDVLVVPSHFYF